jgi:hypothetical protein
MTSPKSRHHLKGILHPYVFFLKEGREIQRNFLDYSLMMLFINSSETIRSPDLNEIKLSKKPKK